MRGAKLPLTRPQPGKRIATMERMNVVLSLTTKDNDYQRENAAAAEQAAAGLSVELEVMYAENDAITQSQQLLEVIQCKLESRPHAILLERSAQVWKR
jgi:hypothetical protein